MRPAIRSAPNIDARMMMASVAVNGNRHGHRVSRVAVRGLRNGWRSKCRVTAFTARMARIRRRWRSASQGVACVSAAHLAAEALIAEHLHRRVGTNTRRAAASLAACLADGQQDIVSRVWRKVRAIGRLERPLRSPWEQIVRMISMAPSFASDIEIAQRYGRFSLLVSSACARTAECCSQLRTWCGGEHRRLSRGLDDSSSGAPTTSSYSGRRPGNGGRLIAAVGWRTRPEVWHRAQALATQTARPTRPPKQHAKTRWTANFYRYDKAATAREKMRPAQGLHPQVAAPSVERLPIASKKWRPPLNFHGDCRRAWRKRKEIRNAAIERARKRSSGGLRRRRDAVGTIRRAMLFWACSTVSSNQCERLTVGRPSPATTTRRSTR